MNYFGVVVVGGGGGGGGVSVKCDEREIAVEGGVEG